jgi:hypothetical protein
LKRLPTLALAGLGLTLALGTLELGLRVLRPRHTGLRGLLYQATLPTDYGRIGTLRELLDTTVLGYRPLTEEDGYVLNSRGFRTPEYSQAKPAGTLRVVALGDSFTFGGVPDAAHWCLRLQDALATSMGQPAEVLRLAVPGTGPPFYLRLWELEGAALRPDAVVVALFVGNDFFDEQDRQGGWRGLVDRAAAASYAARLARNLTRLDGAAVRSRGASGPRLFTAGGYELPGRVDRQALPTFSSAAFTEIERDRMTLCLRSSALAFAVRLERVVRVLRDLAASVRRSGARLTVMVIPDEYQVSHEVAAAAAAAQGASLEDYDLALPQRALATALATEGIPMVDLLPAFRDAREALYVPRDTHWNAAGHALASLELASFLQRGSPPAR